MSSKSLSIENLAKQYRLGQFGTGTISHDLNRLWYKIRGKEDPYLSVTESNDRQTKGKSDYVWALRDVSFDLNQGDVLGIIGKNGAGKSTLLKIMSRITAPTRGKISIKGRMSSLLEVGTGFHPELTGKENVYLNGAILGMTKKEVARKLDEIVDFSGCARYIDTPVKRYSSGMIVRLGFAVAAHLESEILVVDEVLAVGDQEFQNKCIGKMKDISKGGRTVLFVSHNISSVRSLCTKGLLIENGVSAYFGDVSSAIERYLKTGISEQKFFVDRSAVSERIGNGQMKIETLEIFVNGQPSAVSMIGDLITIRLKVTSLALSRFKIAIHIFNFAEICVSNIENVDSGFLPDPFAGERIFEISFRDFRLYPDQYTLGFWIGDKVSEETFDYAKNCIGLNVIEGSAIVKRSLPKNSGMVFLTPEWKSLNPG
ncbi:MAG: ABC transporter ATP-binding protein [Bacteroidetes bacterium]|nr:ABC transporter ATP-binding protein [Bacteroidota bacterium]